MPRRVPWNEQPLPYGAIPRLVMVHVSTEAVRTRSRVIDIGESMRQYLLQLGLQVLPLNAQIRRQLGVGSDTQGLVVAGVDQNADAARKNLRRGDIILSANYREVTTLEQLEAIIETAEDEGRDAVLLRVQRRGSQAAYIAVRLR